MSSSTGKMEITAFQLGSALVGVMVGLGPLFIARIATFHVGRDAWIIMVLASILVLYNAYIMVKVASYFPTQSFAQYSQVLLGKWFGGLIGSVYILLGIIISGITLWYTGQVIQTYILFHTPSQVITLCLISLSVYASYKGLGVIGRVTEVIFIVTLAFTFFFIPPVIEYGHWSFLRPFAEEFGWKWLHGIWAVLFSFAGSEIVLTLYPFLKKAEKPKMMKQMLGHIGYVCVIFIVAVFTQQLVYPYAYIQKLWLPSIHYVSLVNLPILERSDLVFILFWFCVFFKSNMVHLYRSVIETQHLFRLKSNGGVIVLYGACVYAFSFLRLTPQFVEKMMMLFMQITVVFFIVIPNLYFLLVKWRGYNHER
jgi:spore germination protein